MRACLSLDCCPEAGVLYTVTTARRVTHSAGRIMRRYTLYLKGLIAYLVATVAVATAIRGEGEK